MKHLNEKDAEQMVIHYKVHFYIVIGTLLAPLNIVAMGKTEEQWLDTMLHAMGR